MLASWLACQLFAGRAAFLLVGAMLATAMSANVCAWIIPGQRKVVAQLRAGEPVDPIHGRRAKQRSVHNTYFTLAGAVAMLSQPLRLLFVGERNWLVLVLLMLAGALIRAHFVARHKALVEGGACRGSTRSSARCRSSSLAVWLAPPAPAAPRRRQRNATVHRRFAEVRAVIAQRCAMCHNERIQQETSHCTRRDHRHTPSWSTSRRSC